MRAGEALGPLLKVWQRAAAVTGMMSRDLSQLLDGSWRIVEGELQDRRLLPAAQTAALFFAEDGSSRHTHLFELRLEALADRDFSFSLYFGANTPMGFTVERGLLRYSEHASSTEQPLAVKGAPLIVLVERLSQPNTQQAEPGTWRWQLCDSVGHVHHAWTQAAFSHGAPAHLYIKGAVALTGFQAE